MSNSLHPDSPRERDRVFFEQLSKRFLDVFAVPGEELPTVRCVVRETLVSKLLAIRNDLKISGHKYTTGASMLEHLQRSGLVSAIESEDEHSARPRAAIFLVDIPEGERADELELLQAFLPDGVICYFSALGFHELTTQNVSHHHIAELRRSRSQPVIEEAPRRQSRLSSGKRKFNPLGKLVFRYREHPFYVTSRDPRWLKGVEKRYFNKKTILRMTTLEQTLLDTLLQPVRCGGPGVVFEAWEVAKERLAQHRLLEYLISIDDHRLDRRVGFMMENQGYRLVSELTKHLGKIERDARDGAAEVVSLLPGFDYSRVDARWSLGVP